MDWAISTCWGLIGVLPYICGPPFHFQSLWGVDPGLGVEALVDLAVGALERADEGALLLPAHPDHLLAFVVARLPRLDVDIGFLGLHGVLGHVVFSATSVGRDRIHNILCNPACDPVPVDVPGRIGAGPRS
jgi:hypothetical protein